MRQASKIPRELAQKIGGGGVIEFEDQFIYQANSGLLAAGQIATDNVQVEADAYFIITKVSYMAVIAGQGQTDSSRIIPLVKCLITDSGTGRALMSEPVDVSSLAGDGGRPFVNPTERWIQPNSSMQVQFSNYSTNTVYTDINLYFHGRKVWIRSA